MKKTTKGLILCSFLFSLIVVSLALMPHYTCGCGQFNDSSQFTYIVNSVSEKVLGKPILSKKDSPYK